MKALNRINPVRQHLKHSALSLAAAVGALALSAGSGDAATIFVGNHSFEEGTAATGDNVAQAPWMKAGGTSNNIPTVLLSDIPGTTDPNPDGTNTVHFTNDTGGNIYQVLAATVGANTTYTLKVDVGDRNNTTARGGTIRLGYVSATPTGSNDYGLNLLSATVITNAVPVNGAGATDGWITWESTFTTGASPTGLGRALRIELVTDGGVQTLWDNVRLDAVPEPTTTALLGLGGLALVLRRRK